jgi:hypothetical protein
MSINMLGMAKLGALRMDANSQRESAKLAAENILTQGNKLGWEFSDRIRIERFIDELKGGRQFATETLLQELNGLKTTFGFLLQKSQFAHIPAPDDKYFENDKLFGDDAFEIFEEARQDLKDAGNCLASALYTACVFHLMRVSEFGLRRLAGKLKVKLFDKGKRQQVEDATWDKVIDRVHDKIKAARQLSAGPKKQAQLTRFSEAGDHCTFMKDIWRNSVSHTRKAYIRDEALAAFNRVGDFMKFLARDMKEAK